MNPNIGYNLEYGGNNKTHTEKTKQKISNSLKGKFLKAKKIQCLENSLQMQRK